MLRSAPIGLVLCVVTMLCGACSPPPGPPPPPVQTTGSLPCDISQEVAELSPGFSPVDYGSCASAGECQSRGFQGPQVYRINSAPPQQYLKPIEDAFTLAPPFFKNALCRWVDNIYLDTDPSDPNKTLAWGMRERASITSSPKTGLMPTQIGISEKIFSMLSNTSTPYTTYETEVFSWLLTPLSPWLLANNAPPPQPNPWIEQVSFAPQPDPVTTSGYDPRSLVILAILAHEMGHILWIEKGQDYTVNNVPFYKYSWTNSNFPKGYHVFGRGEQSNPLKNPPGVRELRRDVLYSSQAQASQDLDTIYSGDWASLFATVSLDEDFVETFKLYALTNDSCPQTAPLTSLKISIPNYAAIDVVNNLCNSNSRLYRKAQWMSQFIANQL